jgi:heme exporter protein D
MTFALMLSAFDLGPHSAFIWAAYAAVVIVLGGLFVAMMISGARLTRRLADLQARGVRRRSDAAGHEPGGSA